MTTPSQAVTQAREAFLVYRLGPIDPTSQPQAWVCSQIFRNPHTLPQGVEAEALREGKKLAEQLSAEFECLVEDPRMWDVPLHPHVPKHHGDRLKARIQNLLGGEEINAYTIRVPLVFELSMDEPIVVDPNLLQQELVRLFGRKTMGFVRNQILDGGAPYLARLLESARAVHPLRVRVPQPEGPKPERSRGWPAEGTIRRMVRETYGATDDAILTSWDPEVELWRVTLKNMGTHGDHISLIASLGPNDEIIIQLA